MRKLFNADLLDLIVTNTGFIYCCEDKNEDGEKVAAFYEYTQDTDLFEKLTVSAYITAKFGENGKLIARSLGDFITCRCAKVGSDYYIASYKDGTIKFFDSFGIVDREEHIKYSDYPAISPVVISRGVWFAVPEANCIINYSLKYNRIEMRLGSQSQKAFYNPTDLKLYDNTLFICASNACKIKTIGLENYDVKDYCVFTEPVYQYFRVNNKEYIVMKSGIYELD